MAHHPALPDLDQPIPDAAPVEQVQTRLGPIAVRRTPTRGPGPHEPAVLVHGLGGNSLNWVDLADRLADRLDCVAVDLPGFGATEPLATGGFTLADHQAAVVAVVDELFGGRPVHLFGNSMGGAISVQLAGREPESVSSLCLVSPALPDLVPQRTSIQVPVMAVPGVGNRLFDRFQQVEAQRRARATFNLCYADPKRVHPQRLAEAVQEVHRRDEQPWAKDAFIGSSASLISSYFERGPQRPWALAGRITAPTLLVYGSDDKLVHSRAAHRASASFRNAVVMVIPDCGHVAQMEHPDLVERWWRERCDAAAGGRRTPRADRP